jgi:hypothetical protein
VGLEQVNTHVTRLNKFLAEQEGRPFVWGQRDCNTLALQCLDILTGMTRPRFALIAQGRYHTEAGAHAFASTYPMTLDRVLRMAGAQEVSGGAPRAGDFLLVRRDGEPWLRAHVALNGMHCMTVDIEHGVTIFPVSWIGAYTTMRLPCLER